MPIPCLTHGPECHRVFNTICDPQTLPKACLPLRFVVFRIGFHVFPRMFRMFLYCFCIHVRLIFDRFRALLLGTLLHLCGDPRRRAVPCDFCPEAKRQDACRG